MDILCALVLTALSTHTNAAPPSKEVRAAAITLFDEARALMAQGKHAEACPKLAESQRMDPGIGTLFNLSDCYEQIGKTASAWTGFRDVAAEAVTTGQPRREKAARDRAAAIEPKLSRLKIVVSPEASIPGLEITRDGAFTAQALWGTPVPLDPGSHAVVATAPGKKRWETTVMLDKPGVVVVEIPVLARDEAPATSPITKPTSTGSPSQAAPLASATASARPGERPPPDQLANRTWRAPLGIAVMSVGVAGVGVSIGLGFLAKSTFNKSNADGHCDEEGFCDPTGLDLRDKARRQGHIGTAVFATGAVLAAGGFVLWLTAPSSSPSATTAPKQASRSQRPSPAVGGSLRIVATPGGLQVIGTY